MKQDSPWLVKPPNEAEAVVRLVCVPHAGGGASSFYGWRARLSEQIAVTAVQLPGREERLREPLVRSLDEIVNAVSGALFELDARPLVLFGHSFGALVAFVVARTLSEKRPTVPSLLIVSGRASPVTESHAPRLAHLSPANALREAAERYGGVPAAVLEDPELRAVQGRILQADLEMTERYAYQPGQALACPIVAIGGADDAWVSRRELDAWQQCTTGEFSCFQFPGAHFYYKDAAADGEFFDRLAQLCTRAGPNNGL